MDTVPLYRESYVAHCAPPARSCRPPPVPPVRAPLADSTEHRDRFLGDAVEVCPAVPLLHRVPGCVVPPDAPASRWNRRGGCGARYRFADRDEVGHEWYTLEPANLPGPHDIVYDAHRYVPGDTVEAANNRLAAARAVSWSPSERPSSIPAAV